MSKTTRRSNRREFLRGLGRGVAVAAVAGVTALLLLRNGKAAAPPECPGGGRCKGCRRAATCSLPPARDAQRRAATEDDDA